MNQDFIRNLVSNLDEDDIREVLEQVDIEMVFAEAAPYISREIQPHLEDIKHRAQQDDDPQEVREFYANLPEEEQQEVFDQTLADLVVVVRECREQPDVGLGKLKKRIRDPDVLEPLLLIFDEPTHIDPAYSEDVKQFAANLVRWAGAQIIPEAYTQSELTELQSRLSRE